MLRTVTAIERDGWDIRTLTIIFEVPNGNFNLKYWVRKAAEDYCKTEDGKKIYSYNCSYFNWADFDIYVPSEFCEKYGFKKIDSALSDIIVDWDEQLVDDVEMENNEEEE